MSASAQWKCRSHCFAPPPTPRRFPLCCAPFHLFTFFGADGDYTYLANDGPVFWFRTNLDAPRYKVVRFNIETQAGDPSTWDEIIPQKEDTLQWASCHAETRLVASYMHDVQEVLAIHDLDGVFVRNLPLPTVGTVSSLSGRRKYSACFYKFVSFTYPGTLMLASVEGRGKRQGCVGLVGWGESDA